MKLFAPARWPRFTSLPLALEITLVLVIKIVILLAIRQAFFSAPQAKKMLVPMPEVEQHLLSGAATNADATRLADQAQLTPSHPRQEENHGSN